MTRIVTPGTLTDEALLQPRASNFLAAIAESTDGDAAGLATTGLAWIDVSTGRFFAATLPAVEIADQLARIEPAELLVSEDGDTLFRDTTQAIAVTRRAAWSFAHRTAVESLARQFGTRSLDGFGFDHERDVPALRAAGAVLDYLTETQKASLAHVDSLLPYSSADRLSIDPATRRSLELVATIRDGGREGSLLGVMDRTVTSLGARLLADWLAAPLVDVAAIDERLNAVAELVADASLAANLRDSLAQIYDVQRLLARVITGRASPRDLSFVGRTLSVLPKVKAKLAARSSALLQQLEARLDLCADIRGPLEQALVDECPLVARDGGFVRSGYHRDLDELRELMAGGKQWMAEYQATECERTGIPSIKVGFNSVFGYYLEITHVHRDKIPANYIRKQTVKNAERYITPELKEYEEKVLTAEERAKELELSIFGQLRELVAGASSRLQATANALAEIDVLSSLAELARSRGYVRPTVVAESVLDIEAGRHPVLDVTEPDGTFVPNGVECRGRMTNDECRMPNDEGSNSSFDIRNSSFPSILLITGPNMAGKSTYIRQTALLTLMAQMGSFVPAKRATVGVADRIFARVGASDELSRGQSTFMVEMTETARILNTATARSLVILDEIGRGTSTYDGLSLAWSIVEHIHERIGCRTLFATHYHELTDLEDQLTGVANFNVAVKEWQDEVVFLHQIVPGAADKSYGIHVAQLAGVPRTVNERAREVLAWLEAQHETNVDATELPATKGRLGRPASSASNHWQLTLFGGDDHPVLDEIRAAKLDELTPLEALRMLAAWKERLADERVNS